MIELNSEQTIAQLFEHAIIIENKAAEIYNAFSRLFSHIPEVSAFWDGLKQDEILHADTLTEIFESLTLEQLQSPTEKQLWDNMTTVYGLANKDLISPVKNLDDAYETTHQLEFSEVNVIYKFLAIEFIPFEERSNFLLEGIDKHEKKLMDFSRDFGDRAWRKQILIQQT